MSAYENPKIKAGSAVDKELLKLHNSHGYLTGEVIVVAGTNPKNPLHKMLPWDNAYCGEKHRLAVANRIAAAAYIVWRRKATKFEKAAEIRVPAYPSVGQGKKVKRAVALSDAEMRAHIIRTKLNRLKSTVISVGDVKELDHLRRQVIKMVDATAAKLQIDLD